MVKPLGQISTVEILETVAVQGSMCISTYSHSYLHNLIQGQIQQLCSAQYGWAQDLECLINSLQDLRAIATIVGSEVRIFSTLHHTAQLQLESLPAFQVLRVLHFSLRQLLCGYILDRDPLTAVR